MIGAPKLQPLEESCTKAGFKMQQVVVVPSVLQHEDLQTWSQ